jgi:CubicO group peptidase (beta-lactamase class C family)
MARSSTTGGGHLAAMQRSPDFPKADSIRVTDLLHHTSGIPHETIPDSERTHPFTVAEVVERASRLPLDFSPGSRASYSSGGFEVLARVLELASGRTYAQLLEEHLFVPLGMTHSADADSRRLLPGRAQGYVPGPGGPQPVQATALTFDSSSPTGRERSEPARAFERG